MGEESQVPRSTLRSALRYLWRILVSTRLAAILLAVLLLASLLASLLPQMPSDPAAREPWLAAVRLRYRNATGPLHALGLFDLHHTAWFLALLAALLLNALLCTVQRLPRLWKSLTQAPRVTQPEAFYGGFAQHAEWPVASLEAGLAAARQVLARHRYRTVIEYDGAANGAQTGNLYAERGRWAQTGTLLSHLALLLLLVAVLARPALGWQQDGVVLLPGRTQPLEREPELAVQTGSLTIDRYSGGEPRRYEVPLTILAGDSPLVTRSVGINHPLSHQGIAFHLEGYGPAVQLTVGSETVDLAFSESQSGEVQVPGTDVTLRVAYLPEAGTLFVEAMAPDGALLGSGTVADGQELVVAQSPITFHSGTYTTWQISRDPTFGLAVAAGGLLLVGIGISLCVPHRRLWLRVDSGRMRLAGAGEFGGQFETLAERIAHQCSPAGESDGQ